MKFETKYNTGEVVYHIGKTRKKVWIECPECLGFGQLNLKDGRELQCSKCFGRKGHNGYDKEKIWEILRRITLGKVRIEYIDNKEDEKTNYTLAIDYMAIETGISSGLVYLEKDLFPTEKKALAECERRMKDGS